ncbi:MAG: DUF1302 domain-containing protein [Bermanella sp.]
MKKHTSTSTLGRKKILALAIPLVMAAQAQSFEFYTGGIEGSFDSEISMGSSWRVEAQDDQFLANGNEEDGNANFSEGSAFSQVFKGSHDLQLSYKNFGGFVRGKYWYDSALADNNVDRGHTPTATIGNDLSVTHAGGGRLDDSEFNDLSKFSGAEILDAFVYGEFNVLGMPLDVRLGKQVVSWGESTFILGGINAVNPVDVNGFTRPGAEIKEILLPVNMAYANIGLSESVSLEAFYQLEYQESVLPGCGTYFSPNDYISDGCNVVTLEVPGVSASLKRSEDEKPSDDGQFGLSMRYVAEELGDTEFGLYYMNIHSRTPTGNGRKFDAQEVGTLMAAGVPQGAAVISSTSYFVAYPEDLQIMGLSFATTLGSVAFSGELSYHKDTPIQINAGQLITATLFGSTQGLAPIGKDSTILDAEVNAIGPGGEVVGYREFDVSQAQFTAIKFIDRFLGADRFTLIGEVGYTFIHDFAEGDNQIRYQRDGFFDQPENSNEGFVTESAWGYRTLIIGEYSDVFSGINLKPSLAWNHDVEGSSPTNTSGFGEGKQSVDISLDADYLSTYKASISYTQFMGGDFNAKSDKDFASISVGMQF